MFDTHEIARSLTDANLTPAQADAITAAIRQAAEHGEHVTPQTFSAGLTELRAEIAQLETRLVRWIVGTVAVAVAVIRFLGQ